ncbi:probable G-protein coupled receptor 132 [Scyliorhinus canicula]|uniref:probable G-protein coupled receptor 132 n=1 Tax=Scyliorhinus canicula TaxID=7830 RepID=UPI0018F777DB|nr:probable G-protein coupled receptor 132 [Scyliorhinus canicula]XP_038642204.1 probable G-protein coupled receptor 132 [Scyliorhinus canicula]XP_038642205.1 probable G-protein coupled receptor 132 [Scyliorhinus canicula]
MNQSSSNCSQCKIDFQKNSVELAAMYSVIFTVSFTMNCLTLWPIILQVKQRNVLGVYLLSLSISDFFYVLTIPLWVLYYYNGHHWKLSRAACFFSGFVFYSNVYISIFLLCCISTDRYLAVVYPIESQGFRRPGKAVQVSLLIFLATFALHLAIFLSSTSQDVGHDADNMTCFEHIPLVQSVAIGNYLRFTAGFLVPLLILAWSYQRIVKGVRKSLTLGREQKAKVKLISISVIIIFVICFAPYHIILLLRTIYFTLADCSCDFEEKVHLAFNVALALTSLNSAVDPILYVLVSNGVKKDLRNVFTSFSCTPFAKGRAKGSPISLTKTTALISGT